MRTSKDRLPSDYERRRYIEHVRLKTCVMTIRSKGEQDVVYIHFLDRPEFFSGERVLRDGVRDQFICLN